MKKILVTGGAGFVGSKLVHALVKRGYRVRVFDNEFRERSASYSPVDGQVDFIKGDIRKAEELRPAVEGIDTVFHLAYINGTEFFYKYPRLVLDVAIRGQLNMIDAAKQAEVKSFMYFSSSEVYQLPSEIPTPENVPLTVPSVKNPRYSYGGGKIISELLLFHYSEHSDMRKIVVRPHNIYGPAMGFEHVIPQIVKKIAISSQMFSSSEASITIQGDGTETRSFCHIDDAVNGFLLCAELGKDGDIYHVGKDEETSIHSLVQMIARICGVRLSIETSPVTKGSVSRRCPDIGRLRTLGYNPHISLKDGLEETVSWYRDYFINNPSMAQ